MPPLAPDTPRVHERLADVFVRALDLPPDTDVTGLAYARHEHWDSVGHMALVAELEAVYDVMLSTDDVVNLSDYQAAVDTLRRHGVEP
jgi:acyl carrier protein